MLQMNEENTFYLINLLITTHKDTFIKPFKT
jgi:hypothetical protein